VKTFRLALSLLILFLLVGIGWQIFVQLDASDRSKKDKKDIDRPLPVMVEEVKSGSIALKRTFSGALEADAEFYASPKVGGVVNTLFLNLGDSVSRGQVVAILDSAEFDQALIQAEAELEVAQANLQEAQSLLTIAERETRRIDRLNERGISSASQKDTALADQLAKQAHVKVSMAELARARALLETARIRRDYTRVVADWHGEDEKRLVAARLVDEGATVDANTSLLQIVKLNPVKAVFFVSEKDYSGLIRGQKVLLTTDAWPGQTFTGVMRRISPVFNAESRQARIEVEVENSQLSLKPGMFVRAEVILRSKDSAVIVPQRALTRRDDKEGVFQLSDDEETVLWKEVETGIHQDKHVEILAPELHGQVVVLGQQLLKDGSRVILTSPSGN